MRLLACVLVLVSFFGYAQNKTFNDVSPILETVKPDSIRAHIQYLADDRLKGRFPGTPEYQLAIDYVVAHFKRLGIEPGAGNNSYLQPVRLRRAKIDSKNTTLTLQQASSNRELNYGTDFLVTPHFEEKNSSVEASLVFVGYGISMPEFNYDDYAGIDVKGKIVVMINGNPDHFSSTVKAHAGSRATKIQTAIEKGALGIIIREISPRGFAATQSLIEKTGIVNGVSTDNTLFSPSSRGGGGMGLKLFGFVNQSTFDQLVGVPEGEMTTRMKSLTEGKPASFELKSSLKASYQSFHEDIDTYNVVGVLKGSDQTLRNEYVVHSSHLDHMGIGNPVKGDSIYNGAHDNASGVSCTMEVARLYSQLKNRPKRSILFVMVTGEEMGLLGSTYFGQFPTVPKDKIVANVNMDMPTIIAPLLSVVPLGAQHSSLMTPVRTAAKYLKLDVEEDPEPEQNRFVRSDQYSFVRQGIPALHIKYGEKTNEPGKKVSDQVKVWREEIYHKPQDQITGTFDFNAGKKYVQLCFLISYQVAQETARPSWNKGDFFGERFGKP